MARNHRSLPASAPFGGHFESVDRLHPLPHLHESSGRGEDVQEAARLGHAGHLGGAKRRLIHAAVRQRLLLERLLAQFGGVYLLHSFHFEPLEGLEG